MVLHLLALDSCRSSAALLSPDLCALSGRAFPSVCTHGKPRHPGVHLTSCELVTKVIIHWCLGQTPVVLEVQISFLHEFGW
jgi:hypothetical protein